jgi:hypothetical protein
MRPFAEPFGEPQARQVGNIHELDAEDRDAVGANLEITDSPASPADFEGHVHDVSLAVRQVIAKIQEPSDLDVQTGFLAHLPYQRFSEGFAFFQSPSGERISAEASLLAEQQDAIFFDHHPGDANLHAANLRCQTDIPAVRSHRTGVASLVECWPALCLAKGLNLPGLRRHVLRYPQGVLATTIPGSGAEVPGRERTQTAGGLGWARAS